MKGYARLTGSIGKRVGCGDGCYLTYDSAVVSAIQNSVEQIVPHKPQEVQISHKEEM